jgi:hypothetical protein
MADDKGFRASRRGSARPTVFSTIFRSSEYSGDAANGNGKPSDEAEIETIVEVADDLTSQSRHSLLLQGSPPHGKLLIPLERRDVRVVEGARLESDSGNTC